MLILPEASALDGCPCGFFSAKALPPAIMETPLVRQKSLTVLANVPASKCPPRSLAQPKAVVACWLNKLTTQPNLGPALMEAQTASHPSMALLPNMTMPLLTSLSAPSLRLRPL